MGEKHAYAFTVAKATGLELLGKTLAMGQGFATWHGGMLKDLARLGWAGPAGLLFKPE